MAKKKHPKKIEITKTIYIDVKDLSFKNDQNVDDLIRFLKEDNKEFIFNNMR